MGADPVTATAVMAAGGMALGALDKEEDEQSTTYTETPLAKTQREWLEYQIGNYKDVFFPYLKSGLENATDIKSPYNIAQMREGARATQEAYASANRATSQSLKQQGLAGDKSGVENLMRGYNERAKSSSLANSYYNQLLNMETNKQRYLQMGLGMTPGTTGATPMNSETEGTHKPTLGQGLYQMGQGTQSATAGFASLMAMM